MWHWLIGAGLFFWRALAQKRNLTPFFFKFGVRAKAENDLETIGERTLPALNAALAANPPPELKVRVEGLRGKVTPGLSLGGEQLRAYRAVEVLELIGTPESRQVLQALAAGAPGAQLTISAQAALKR